MDVTVVIPARNEELHLRHCLSSLEQVMAEGEAVELIVVDDGSTDNTAEVARAAGARVLRGKGEGAGAARNLGWRAASTELVWFVDADCVVAPNALTALLPFLEDLDVSAAGGSYGNACPEYLLSSLIHDEIRQRHLKMGKDVNFLATFNILCRRSVLVELGGFYEPLKTAQDADYAFRMLSHGYRLKFNVDSLVEHFHERSLLIYMRVQFRHGFYRVQVYERSPRRLSGDSYSALFDHLQPPLAMFSCGFVALVPVAPLLASLGIISSTTGLAVLSCIHSIRLIRSTGRLRNAWFAPLGFVRAYARGCGLCLGVLNLLFTRRERSLDSLGSTRK